MDPSKYKHIQEMQKEKRVYEEMKRYEYNVKAAKKARQELKRKIKLVDSEQNQTTSAADMIRNIREQETLGYIDVESAEEQCFMLSYSSYCDICRKFPRKD